MWLSSEFKASPVYEAEDSVSKAKHTNKQKHPQNHKNMLTANFNYLKIPCESIKCLLELVPMGTFHHELEWRWAWPSDESPWRALDILWPLFLLIYQLASLPFWDLQICISSKLLIGPAASYKQDGAVVLTRGPCCLPWERVMWQYLAIVLVVTTVTKGVMGL